MTEKFTGTVLVSDDCGSFQWHVLVPTEFSKKYKPFAINFGFIPINLTVGKSTWPTSLLPYDKGKHFISIPAKIRKANPDIQPNDEISIEFEIRERN